jgi:hypothetical protein
LLYTALFALIVGVLNQDNFKALRDSLTSAHVGPFSSFTALFTGALTGVAGSGSALGASAPIATIFLFAFGWLTLVFLVREIRGGNRKVKLRDGLYGGGASVLSMAVLILVIMVQLIPFAIVLLIYSSLSAVGIINSGVAIENMAAWGVLATTAVLTLYWLVPSFLALAVVNVPGMYPLNALHIAKNLAVSRRLAILFRLFAAIVPLVFVWLVILGLAIGADTLLIGWKITWLPIVPITVLILSTVSVVWLAAYIYLLIDRIATDGAKAVVERDDKIREK